MTRTHTFICARLAAGFGAILGFCIAIGASLPAEAQQGSTRTSSTSAKAADWRETSSRTRRPRFRELVNDNVVTIISGNPNGSFLFYAYDIAAAIGEGDDLRILPVVGRGGAHNVRDILYLRGIDMGITQSNTLSYYRKTGELGGNLENRLAYITRLFVDEMHILVRPGIETIEDLNGKRINFSDAGSGTQLTTRMVMELLNIKPVEVNMGQSDAFEKMRRGELDGTVCVCGKTIKSYAGLKREDGFKLLPIPYSEKLEQDYLPVTITHADYPNLVADGDTVETIGVSTVLAAYNWSKDNERYQRVAKFVSAFFANFEKMKQPPRLAKWKSVNLAARLKGWKRFPAAEEWLAENVTQPVALPRQAPDGINAALARQQAREAAPGDEAKQEQLFQQFLKWVETRREAGN